MKNKDFRNRLKNHKTETNATSWEQMRDLLERNMVIDEKKGNKRKYLWWFFIFIGGALITLPFALKNTEHDSTLENKQVLNQPKIKKEVVGKRPLLSQEDDNSLFIENKRAAEVEQTIKKSILFIGNQNIKNKNKKLVYNSKNEDMGKSQRILKIDTNEYLTDVQDKNNTKNSTFDLKKQPLIGIPKLSLKLLDNPLDYLNNRIITNKKNNWYIQGILGYNDFISFHGIRTGFGVMKAINKQLAFSGDIFYTYGVKDYPLPTYRYHKRIQYGINATIHLNLLRTKKHKFSFEIGLGYYKNHRFEQGKIAYTDIQYPNTSSYANIFIPINLSYTYFLKNNYGLGLKYGFAGERDFLVATIFKKIK